MNGSAVPEMGTPEVGLVGAGKEIRSSLRHVAPEMRFCSPLGVSGGRSNESGRQERRLALGAFIALG